MARVAPVLHNFTSGELSPKLRGRFDLGSYSNGASWMQNFISQVQGPATYRSGTRVSWNTRGDAEAVLIPFQFNTEQAYILEFTNSKMRIYKDGGIVTASAVNITDITAANPAVVTAASHGYSNGDPVIIESVGGMQEVNNREFTVANVTTNTFELSGEDSSTYTAYTSGGTVSEIIEVTTPYTTARLFEFDYAQTTDTMYIVHPDVAPYKLTRSSHTAWTLATYTRTSDPFGSSGNYPSVVAFYEQRLIMAATDNDPQKIWGSTGTDYDDFSLGTGLDDEAFAYTIASGQVNRIRWMSPTEDFLAIGTAGSEFRASGGGQLDAITPTNITIKPVSFYGSENVKSVTLDAHIMYLQKDGRQIRSFEYDLTTGGYTSINRTLIADHITESGIKQMAFQLGLPSVLWAVRNDGILLGFTFEPKEEVKGWHRHVTDGTFESVATIPQSNLPDQVYFVVKRTVDGVTRRFVEYFSDQPEIPSQEDYFSGEFNETIDRQLYEDALWEAQKEMFFVDSGVTYDGKSYATVSLTLSALTGNITVTASGSVFTSDMVGQEIWGLGHGRAVITAYNSATSVDATVTVETFESASLPIDGWYLTNSEFGGLQHLAGATVVAQADGGVVQGLTVTAQGTVDIEYQASYVNIGLPYYGIIRTMPLEGGGDNGPSATKNKSLNRVGVRFINTLGAKIGTSLYNMTSVPFRDASDLMGRPAPLFNGIKEVSVGDDWNADKSIFIYQDLPLPCTVAVLQPHYTTNDG